MRIDTGQHMRMDQRMKLAPRMIQSMEILQLPLQALEERIEQELVANPTLELREPGDEQDLEEDLQQEERDKTEGERELAVKDDSVDPSHKDDFERLSNISEEWGETWEANTFDTGESYRPARDTGERDVKMDAMANTASRPASLLDQLLGQWHLVETTDELRAAGDYLISHIDDDGYIRTDEHTLLVQAPAGMTQQILDEALALLQLSLEPVGLAARDLRECLMLQIDSAVRQSADRNGDAYRVERLLVDQYLKDIENNRIPKIAKSAGLSIDQVKEGINNLRKFHPHPGRMLVEDSPRLIRPDAIIEFDEVEDRYVAMLTSERMPSLQISQRYLKMAHDKGTDKQTKEFVNNNIRSARWLIEAIEQRQSTLLRVINVVIEAQRDFFDQGPQHLKPLPMTLVADQLGIHVATVSRAVSEKYLQTPRGIFPLRMFFSGGTETEAGEAMSWSAVQAKLDEIIKAEDKSDPLNDDQLAEKLKEQGIDIARRTVAKYRKQLNIPPARQRKEF